MQSTVIINCTRGRGHFYFSTCHNITVEGLTVVNCGGLNHAVFYFSTVQNIFFYKNSIQHMTGSGVLFYNCNNVLITNCSYYNSALCNISGDFLKSGGAVGIVYNTQYSNTGYTLELSHSNMTKCCSYGYGGGIDLNIRSKFGSARLLFSHLVFSHNKALYGGGFQVAMLGEGDVTLVISDCLLVHGSALIPKCVGVDCDRVINGGGGMHFYVTVQSTITIQNTHFLENFRYSIGEIYFDLVRNVSLSILNSTIVNKETYSGYGVLIIIGHSTYVKLANNRMRFANIPYTGFELAGYNIDIGDSASQFQMVNCHFERCINVSIIVRLIDPPLNNITNCIFSNNTGGRSVIAAGSGNIYIVVKSSIISDNNMTGITLDSANIKFIGRNVIQKNRNTEGAGIVLVLPAYIQIDGELILYNNTADKHGGAIIVKQPLLYYLPNHASQYCTLSLKNPSSSVTFSGNRAGKGGSDIYGAILMGCDDNVSSYVPHVGQPNETSWYFDIPFKKQLHFSNTDRLSSMSSDPIMVCFCNTTTNLPDCSDRTHHIQTYPGIEINTSIATVGYYGGTSPGVVLVSAQHAILVRYYGQNQTTNCFQLHILLQNTSSTTALVDIRVYGGLQSWGVSIGVDILDCPIGFTQISGQCHCEHFLDTSNVQCNLSATPFMLLRSGNSWFAYNN